MALAISAVIRWWWRWARPGIDVGKETLEFTLEGVHAVCLLERKIFLRIPLVSDSILLYVLCDILRI
jgi:hypothetical protein